MTQLKLEVEAALPSALRNSTDQYSIFVSCNKCAGVHGTGISITIENGPVDKQSIGDFYSGKSLPKTLATLSNQSFPNLSRKTQSKYSWFRSRVDASPRRTREEIEKRTSRMQVVAIATRDRMDSTRNVRRAIP